MRKELVRKTPQLLGVKNRERVGRDSPSRDAHDPSKGRLLSDGFAFKGGGMSGKTGQALWIPQHDSSSQASVTFARLRAVRGIEVAVPKNFCSIPSIGNRQ